MKEHLRTKEALVTNIDVDHVAVDCLMNEVPELLRLSDVSVRIYHLFVVFFVLFEHILAYVSVFFFNFRCNFSRIFGLKLLSTVFQHLQGELCDVSASQGDALYATAYDISVAHGEDVGNALTRVNDSARQVTAFEFVKLCIWAG